MAQNNSRNMKADFDLGIIENTYMQLQPDWSTNTANAPVERLSWPTYAQAERHSDVAHEMRTPMTPREPAPPGGVYHVRRGSGVNPQEGKMALIQSLNAGGS